MFQSPCGEELSATREGLRCRVKVVVFQSPCGEELSATQCAAASVPFHFKQWFQSPCGEELSATRRIKLDKTNTWWSFNPLAGKS